MSKGNTSGPFLFTISDSPSFHPTPCHAVSALYPHLFPGNHVTPELHLGTKGEHPQQPGLSWEAGLQKTGLNPGSGLGCLERYSWFYVLEVWHKRAGDGALGIHVGICWPLISSPCEKCHGQNRADVGPSKCPGSSHLKLV